MKCPKCQMNIPDDSLYCPICGTPRDYVPPSDFTCPTCGTALTADMMFCPECGTPRPGTEPLPGSESDRSDSSLSGDETQPLSVNHPSGGNRNTGGRFDQTVIDDFDFDDTDTSYNPYRRQKSGTSSGKIIGIAGAALLLFLIVASAFFYLGSSGSDTGTAISDSGDSSDQIQRNSSADSNDNSADISDADYDLTENSQLRMSGLIKTSQSGSPVFRWDNPLTFYGIQSDGTEILMQGTQSAYIDDTALPDDLLSQTSANEEFDIRGRFYFKDESLYVTPFEILDKNGEDIITKAETAAEADGINDPDGYILPDSSSRILTESDIQGMSLQEINYAKNEIYARKGRRFKSAELQNYFNSKSWYRGTVDADAFSESLLSDVERKNADFLAGVEFGMAPNGYQLDAN